MPAPMFIAQATDTLQMLRDVSDPLDQAGLEVIRRNHGAESAPLAVISRHARSEKPELNFAAFCQASLPRAFT